MGRDFGDNYVSNSGFETGEDGTITVGGFPRVYSPDDIKVIDVIAPGTRVKLITGLEAIVDAVMIEGGEKVSYKIVWEVDEDLKDKWVNPNMIEHVGNWPINRVGLRVE